MQRTKKFITISSGLLSGPDQLHRLDSSIVEPPGSGFMNSFSSTASINRIFINHP